MEDASYKKRQGNKKSKSAIVKSKKEKKKSDYLSHFFLFKFGIIVM